MTRLTVLIATTALAPPALGVQPDEDRTGEPPVLGGPEVDEDAGRETLVRRGYDGALEPLDARPEVAALDLLDLDADTWEAINAILDERAAVIDGVVTRNIRTLAELQTARAAGDAEAQRELLGSLVGELGGLRRSGRLVDTIAAALPEEHVATYRRLVRERHMARFEELRAEAREAGEEDPDAAAIRRLIAELMGLEIRRSYDRIVEFGTRRLEETLEALRLDPETEDEVRRLVQEFAQRTALNPTAEERRGLFARIYEALPPDARRRLIEMYRGGRGD